jgi:hypothetical protein
MQNEPMAESQESTMSSVFPDWQKFAVHQRRPLSGCIPTAYEMILRSVGAKGVHLERFQDDFDLDKDLKPGGMPRNNFESVASEVRKKYPAVRFSYALFEQGKGADKLAFVEKRPVVVSIANEPFGGKGWHIMPVVDATADDLILLKGVDASGTPKTCNLRKDEFIRIHDCYDGGNDVAFLESWENV